MRKFVVAFVFVAAACTGPTGPAGMNGTNGTNGTNGADGAMGLPGLPGTNGLSAWNTAPGIDVTITDLSVTASAATISFTLDDTDGAGGAPLDRSGRLTTGTIGVRFALAQLAANGSTPGAYGTYTTTTVGATTKPGTESIEANFVTVDVATGTYRYTIAAPLTGFDPTRTQTAIAVATRTVDGATVTDRAIRSVRPDGGTMLTRDVAATSSCTSCHGSLAVHEERFDAIEQCVLCHADGRTDPVSGNSLDLRVMVHKLHRGENLPSVRLGGTYGLADAAGAVHDYSTVAYPQPIARCESCHAGASSTAWRTQPSIAACTSCHDTTSFDAVPAPNTLAHGGGPTPDETMCVDCHQSTTGSSPIVTRHVDPSINYSQNLEVAIVSVEPAAPGLPVTFTFRVTLDGAPLDILLTPLGRMRAIIAGPNGDFGETWTVGATTTPYLTTTVQGSGATGTLAAVDSANGLFSYTFSPSVPIPVTATTSFTLGLEARLRNTMPYSIATSVTQAIPLTGVVAQRRAVVETARCASCHFELTHHGISRGVATCVLCHNPESVDRRVARWESSTVVAESVDFRVMVHRIHAGGTLAQPYFLGTALPDVTNPAGFMVDFAATRLPRSSAACESCHAPGTYGLPASEGRRPVVTGRELVCVDDPSSDPDSYCTTQNVSSISYAPPETASCTSCHAATYTAAHAELNTTASGVESCTTCHGPGRTADVARVHPR